MAIIVFQGLTSVSCDMEPRLLYIKYQWKPKHILSANLICFLPLNKTFPALSSFNYISLLCTQMIRNGYNSLTCDTLTLLLCSGTCQIDKSHK